MKSKGLAVALVSCIGAVPAFSQVSVYIGRTPPPLRYEVQPPMPGPGYAWQDGYWNWGGNRYLWVPGRWNQPPYPNAYWSHPHYDHYDRGWQMQEGHWDREDHGDHHDNGRGNRENQGNRGNQGNHDDRGNHGHH